MTTVKNNFDNRVEVLQYSLFLESFTSSFLSVLLGIQNPKDSKVLGNKGNPISFNQKVYLLIEIGALKSKDKSKFLTFMEVRNQFMHNIQAKTYEDCFRFLEGKEKYILKEYPQDSSLPKETQLRSAFTTMADEILNLTGGLIEKIKEKAMFTAEHELLKKFQVDSFSAIKEIEKTFDDAYEKLVANGQTSISVKEVKLIGKAVRSIFNKTILKGLERKPNDKNGDE